MKRFLFILIGVSLLITPLAAQARLGDFTMRGTASQEMKADGFVAAHPSFPLNSKVKVTNPSNGREIEVTIIDRIDPSLSRIIDLSPLTAQALGIKAGGQVILTVGANRPIRSQNEPVPTARPQVKEETIVELAEPSAPVQVLVERPAVERQPEKPVPPAEIAEKQTNTENFKEQPLNTAVNTNLDEKKTAENKIVENKPVEKKAAIEDLAEKPNNNTNNTEFLAWLMTMSSLDAREARDAREVRESREIREAREAREAVKTAAPAINEQKNVPPAPLYQYAPPVSQPFFDSAPVFQSALPAPAPPSPQYTHPVQQNPTPVVQAPVEPVIPPQYAQTLDSVPPVPSMAPNYKPVPPPGEEISKLKEEKPPAAPKPVEKPAAAPPKTKPSASPAKPVAAAPKPEPSAPVEQPKPNEAVVVAVSPELDPELPKEPIPLRPVTPAAVYPLPVKAEDIQIIPGLPDKSSGKIYRLQIGAYSAWDAAIRAAEYIRASGFDAEMESSGSMFRVLAIGIASPDVYPASVRLGSLGFKQIWVRE